MFNIKSGRWIRLCGFNIGVKTDGVKEPNVLAVRGNVASDAQHSGLTL